VADERYPKDESSGRLECSRRYGVSENFSSATLFRRDGREISSSLREQVDAERSDSRRPLQRRALEVEARPCEGRFERKENVSAFELPQQARLREGK